MIFRIPSCLLKLSSGILVMCLAFLGFAFKFHLGVDITRYFVFVFVFAVFLKVS